MTATAHDARRVRSDSARLVRMIRTRALSTILAASACARNDRLFASMLPASRSGTTRIFARPATVDAICLTAAASTLIALSSARAPSSCAPVIWPRSAISLQRAGHDASARCRDHGGRTAHPRGRPGHRGALGDGRTRQAADCDRASQSSPLANSQKPRHGPLVRGPGEVVATRDLEFYDALGRRLGLRSMA